MVDGWKVFIILEHRLLLRSFTFKSIRRIKIINYMRLLFEAQTGEELQSEAAIGRRD